MKWSTVFSGALGVFLGLSLGCTKETAPTVKAAAWAGEKQTVCPCLEGDVSTTLFVDTADKRIYVCGEECFAAVKKDPAKYIAKLEKEGFKLDKPPLADPKKTAK